VALRDLTPNHPARTYLGERAFDVEDLSRDWHLSYCVRADEEYRLAQDRLIIPVIMNGVWVGWQGRHVGERPWKAERVPKYFTAPGTPRGRVLYNHDLALKRPLVVVCEGPTDVWRVGPAAVALLGKQATPTQLNLVVSGWRDRPVVVLLDGDARADSARLCNQLRPYFKGRLVEVSLPPGQDPGNLSRGELWTLIGAEARHHRVDVVGAAAADSDVPEGCFQAAVGP
jgi:DNA primase